MGMIIVTNSGVNKATEVKKSLTFAHRFRITSLVRKVKEWSQLTGLRH